MDENLKKGVNGFGRIGKISMWHHVARYLDGDSNNKSQFITSAKAQNLGNETVFDREVKMKDYLIGADTAGCKQCSMGPCRLNAKEPYDWVGVCGATIDTIMARNFANTLYDISMLDLFRLDLFGEVVDGKIFGYEIKDVLKLESVAQEIGIETDSAKRMPFKDFKPWRKLGIVPRGATREIMELMNRTNLVGQQEELVSASRFDFATDFKMYDEKQNLGKDNTFIEVHFSFFNNSGFNSKKEYPYCGIFIHYIKHPDMQMEGCHLISYFGWVRLRAPPQFHFIVSCFGG